MPMNTTYGPNPAGNKSSGASGGAVSQALNANSSKNMAGG